MEASQEVTGDAKIDSIFDREFINKVSQSYNVYKHRNAKVRAETRAQEEELNDEEVDPFEWLNE